MSDFISDIKTNIQYNQRMAEHISSMGSPDLWRKSYGDFNGVKSEVLSKSQLFTLLTGTSNGEHFIYQFNNGDAIFYSLDCNFGRVFTKWGTVESTWVPGFRASTTQLSVSNNELVDVQPRFQNTIFPPAHGKVVLETIEALTDYLIAHGVEMAVPV